MFGRGGLDRRALLQQALLLAGAGAILPGVEAIGRAAVDSPFRYSAGDMALLTRVADLIIPRGNSVGAVDAGVPEQFEGLMANWASAETRAAMAGVLATIAALPGDRRSFVEVTAAEQERLLTAHDAVALAPVPGAHGNPFGPPPAADAAYARFKQLVVTLFYLSQPALTQELAYTQVPGRWSPSVPVTPATRPEGGPGMF